MLTEQQTRFRAFLLKSEERGSTFTLDDIVRETGWEPQTARAYRSKGHWDGIVVSAGRNRFKASGVSGLSETEFLQLLTQSARAREFGAWCRQNLSRALLAKSRDNMVLALELFNRPTITNRVDAFVILFVVAWEQLLKAMDCGSPRRDSSLQAAQSRQEARNDWYQRGNRCRLAIVSEGPPQSRNYSATSRRGNSSLGSGDGRHSFIRLPGRCFELFEGLCSIRSNTPSPALVIWALDDGW